ncbi:ground-like domain protein [Ancylostoma caninum]|uniref:Ground-like domain protein n=1 Tax=Ancylostoma caninum TaxID=29170 RepID=A0A368G731_ANCCA|nr:ground-like domain protein [Ancylostoma caninum]
MKESSSPECLKNCSWIWICLFFFFVRFQPCPPCPDPAPPVQCQTDVEDGTTVSPENQYNSRFSLKIKRRGSEQRERRALKSGGSTCNSVELKRIMRESIHDNILMAKIAIVNRAAVEIGGHFDAVCATGKFSYFAVARLFCEVTSGDVSCFAFRHDDISGQNVPKLAAMPEQDESSEERMEPDLPLEKTRMSIERTTDKPSDLSTKNAEDETAVEELAEMTTIVDLDESTSEETNKMEEDPETLAVGKRSRMIWPPQEITLENARTQGLREETIMELEQQAKKKHLKKDPELDVL